MNTQSFTPTSRRALAFPNKFSCVITPYEAAGESFCATHSKYCTKPPEYPDGRDATKVSIVFISASRSRETPRPNRSKSIAEAKALSLVTTGRILSSAASLCWTISSKRFARLCRRAAAFSVRRLNRLLIVTESEIENMPLLVYLRLVPTLAISQSIASSLAVKSLSEGSFFKISSMGVRPAGMYSVSKSGTPGLLESP